MFGSSKNKEKWRMLAQNVLFLRNRSSYSFRNLYHCNHGMTENLRVHWVWPSKYKEKWHFSPKSIFFFRNRSIIQLWNLYHCDHYTWKPQGDSEFDPLNTKKSDVVILKCCFFFRNGSSYSFETCTIVIITPENLRVHWVWYSKYKEKWCCYPKMCFFSETDHHTALKLVPLWSSHLKTWECTGFGPLNTKKSDAFSSKCAFLGECGSSYSFETCTIVIIRPENLRVHWVWLL